MSLASKMLAILTLLVGAAMKWTGVFQSLEIKDLCLVAFSIMGICGTVDVNITLDKFLGRNVKGTGNEEAQPSE